MTGDQTVSETMSVPEQLTVAALLREPPLQASRVLHGMQGMARPVAWCLPWSDVFSHNDMVNSVVVHARADELLTVADLTSALGRLGARGVAAVLVSGDTGRLDLDLLVDAPAELPIVQLPRATGFALTNRVVAEQCLARAAYVLEYGVRVHRTLAALLHRGSGLPAFGRQLATLSRSPVFVLDPHGEVLSYEYLGAASVPDPFEIARLLREATTGVTGSAPAPGVHLVELALEDEKVTCVVGPIVLDRRHYGTVVVVELDHPALPEDIGQHCVIVEQATTIVGSELLRQRSVEEAMERARGDFVHALLHGRFANPHDLIARAAHHDFNVAARYGVVTVQGLDVAATGQSQTMSLVRRAEHVMQRAGIRTLATVVDDVLVVIREVAAAVSTRAEKNPAPPALAEYAAALAQDLEARYGRPLTVTYGRPARGVPGIAESYREARMTLGVCVRLKMRRVSGYSDLRVFAALADVAASQQARQFAQEVLQPLRSAGTGSDLERTVMAYVEAGGNLNAAARALQLHRNTMLYKLDRAARLLGVDLRDADNQFMVWLAHRIDLLSEVQSSLDERLQNAG